MKKDSKDPMDFFSFYHINIELLKDVSNLEYIGI